MSVKRVLISGAAKRIGAACARLLHEEGCSVFLHYRGSKAEVTALSEELNQKRPDSAIIWQADLLKLEELRAMAEAAESAWGGLDVLINNASAFYPTEIADLTEQQWDELLGSNLKAPFFLIKALAPALAENYGCVVNIVDIHSERGLKGYPVYSIAKAGMAAMTKIMAKELGPKVRVNGVSPGAILWPEEELSGAEKKDIISRVALQRSGDPCDIAKAVRFLVEDADYITGQVISIDGGRTLFC